MPKITLLKPLPDLFIQSLLDDRLGDSEKRVLGALIVYTMEQQGYPPKIVELAREVYREKFPGMFPDFP